MTPHRPRDVNLATTAGQDSVQTQLRRFLAVLLFVGMILAAPLLYSLSFTSSPSITPSPAVSNDTLNCEWTPTGSGTITANVTWFNGTRSFRNESNIACTSGNPCSTSNDIEGQYVYRTNIWNCSVTLYNGTDTNLTMSSVTIANADPVIQTFPSVTTIEDTVFSLTINGTDAESDTLTWFSNDQNFSDDLFIIDSDSGLISFTSNLSDVGNHTMTIIAIDNNNGSDTIAVNFEVRGRNDPPQFSPALSARSATEDVPFEYIINATDEENTTFNWTLNSSSPDNLILTNYSAIGANLSFNTSNSAPRFEDDGVYTITVIVFDVNNISINTTSSFTLNISAVNQNPIFASVPNATGTQGTAFTREINVTDGDSGDTLTFSVAAINCTGTNPWNISTTSSSANATGWINVTLSNQHVLCPYVNISVSDTKNTSWILRTFNITNTNDVPEIFAHSSNSSNTISGNLTNLSGFLGGTFRYALNATDNDSDTYVGEVLTYTTNNSLFTMGSTSGQWNFIVNSSHIGNFTVLVTVSDDEGLFDTYAVFIQNFNNTIPSLYPLSASSCAEGVACNLSIQANDTDPSENLTFASNDSIHFPLTTINNTAASMNASFDQDLVGNHSINVSVTDSKGALDYEVFTFAINNTNDAPIFDKNANNASDIINVSPVVEGQTTTLLVNITDLDLYLSETLTTTVTFISGANASIITNTTLTLNTTQITILPGEDADGNYTVNVTSTDLAGLSVTLLINFSVYNQSAPPNVTGVQPYYNSTLGVTIFANASSEAFSSNTTTANFSENQSVTFNVSFIDADSPRNNITVEWYMDGTQNSSHNATNNTGVIIPFNLHMQGDHNVSVLLTDEMGSESLWTFDVTVHNRNRAPTLVTSLFNFTNGNSINQTTTYNSYFSYHSGSQRFLDPDDDLNDNNQIATNVTDPNETWSLTVTATSCAVADITISGDDITIEPEAIGVCTVTFTATDSSSATASSNTVTIEVGDVPEETTTTTVTSSAGGGGGGGGSSETVIRNREVEVDVNVPTPLKLITPGELVIYENRTMTVPIVIENTWNESLLDVTLSATAQVAGVQISFTTDFISELPVGESLLTEMTVENYRTNGPYEIHITADVVDPLYTDTSVILVNSLERSGEGDDVQSRVDFARDLLQSNQECLELNTLIDQAIEEIAASRLDEALQLIDAAVNGCKYLINAKVVREEPTTIDLGLFRIAKNYVDVILIALGALILLTLAILLFIRIRTPREE